ncbi:MAG TPA: DsrE family protein [Nitrospinota bacterium]|jgi:predicted peroxiredoxin|nr:DsrE family protein [Nitrospinota bacterium]|tara:strand:- start:33943 stop:34314 length:372 start_codon:yes stop_codon:yes gene_type:complete
MSDSAEQVMFIVTTGDEETFRASMLNAANLLASDVPVKFFISQKACHFFTKSFHQDTPDTEVSVKGRLDTAIKLGAEIIVCRTALSNYGIEPDMVIEKVDPSKGWMDIVDDQTDLKTKVVWVG